MAATMAPYSLEDMARKLGIDLSKIERYAQKGLVIFKNSDNGRLLGGPVEIARLRFILKAEELGYSIDNINRLVGHAYSVLRADDPLASSLSFSRKVFNSLEADLDKQDPLEQLNTKCDLRLLGDYLAELESCKSIAPGKAPAPGTTKASGKPSPPAKKAAPPIRQGSKPARKDKDHAASPAVQKRPKRGMGLKLLATMVVIAAVAAVYFYFQNHRQQVRVKPPAGLKTEKGVQPEASRPDGDSRIAINNERQSFPVPLPEPKVEQEPAPETGKSETGTGRQPGATTMEPQGSADSRVGTENKEQPPAQPLKLPEPIKVEPLPPLAMPETPEKTAPVPQANPETLSAAIDITNFELFYSPAERNYTARFRIIRNQAGGRERIKGYTFVLLKTSSGGLMALPKVKLIDGRPANHRKGRYFSIARLKIQETSGKLNLAPSAISSATVLVYSPSGSLIKSIGFHPMVKKLPARSMTANKKTSNKASSLQVKRGRLKGGPDKGSAGRVAAKSPKGTPEKNRQKALGWEAKSYDFVLKGQYAKAIEAASRAISLAPERVNPYINRALSYIETEMYSKAIKDCNTVLAMDPQNALAYNNRGLSFHRTGKLDKARSDYRKACELGLELGCRNLAGLERETKINSLLESSRKAFMDKDWTAVIKYTSEVIELDPENSVAYTNRSAAYAEKGRLKEALRDSNKALRLDPSFPLAFNNRGYVYELMGETKKAAADYLKSCSLGFDLGCENLARLEKNP